MRLLFVKGIGTCKEPEIALLKYKLFYIVRIVGLISEMEDMMPAEPFNTTTQKELHFHQMEKNPLKH
jgi:hypothetical protein